LGIFCSGLNSTFSTINCFLGLENQTTQTISIGLLTNPTLTTNQIIGRTDSGVPSFEILAPSG